MVLKYTYASNDYYFVFICTYTVLCLFPSCLSNFSEEPHCAQSWIYFLYYLLKTQQFVINTCSARAGKESKEMW